jgi:hypothetical protein
MFGGVLDVLLRHVAGVRDERRVDGQLCTDRREILLELVKHRVKHRSVRGHLKRVRGNDHLGL